LFEPQDCGGLNIKSFPCQRNGAFSFAIPIAGLLWVVMQTFYRAPQTLASISAMTALEITLFYLLAAVMGVVACRYFKLPPMLGYLAVGVVIGPNAIGALAKRRWCAPSGGVWCGVFDVRHRTGVQLPKLRAMRQHVFGLGLLQVAMTILVATMFDHRARPLPRPTSGRMSWQAALALSCALAMSSTAIVGQTDGGAVWNSNPSTANG
jgi:hypothetical protein